MTIDQLKTAKNFYLVGIKGVGMTSLAQCLLDMGKNVSGCDVAEEFVTQPLLKKLAIAIDLGFDHSLPKDTQVVIFTVAHNGLNNPLVKEAQNRSLPICSHAEALGLIFNQKTGIAVCGVGGKTTVSAMLVWASLQSKLHLSYSVGVGEIIGLAQTGAFNQDNQFFVAEADEYAVNPDRVLLGEKLIARFEFLTPQIIICTNLRFDHPDVYKDLKQTQQVFLQFFTQLKPNGTLIYNQDDDNLIVVVEKLRVLRPDVKLLSFGLKQKAQFHLTNLQTERGLNQALLNVDGQINTLKLKIPGSYNLLNAAAAAAALSVMGLPISQSLKALSEFQSTGRRCQLIKKTATSFFYDDYAHHPSEIRAVIASLKKWYPEYKLAAVFQPHTVSRTKALLDQFAQCFDQADCVILLPIFTSAREKIDYNFSSRDLFAAIKKFQPELDLYLADDLSQAVNYLQSHLKQNIVITLGAGNVYQLHDLLNTTIFK